MGLEGIIAKRRSAPYQSGRGGDWLKIKCIQAESFAIIGYEPSTAALGGIGRLLLAARRGNELVYVGGVGTGFNRTSGTALRKQMDKLLVPKPVVAMTGRKRTYRWIRPELIAEIALRGWTVDGNCDMPPTKVCARKRMRRQSSTSTSGGASYRSLDAP